MKTRYPRITIVSQLRIENPRILHGKVISECYNWASKLGSCIFVCFNKLNSQFNLVIRLEQHKKVKIYSIPIRISEKKSILYSILELLKTQLFLLFKLITLFKREKIDVVRAENIILLGLPTLLASKIARVKYVVWLGGNELKAIKHKFKIKSPFLKRIINEIFYIYGKIVLRNADLVIVLSKDLLKIAQNLKAKRILYTSNFVDLQEFKPKIEKEVERKETILLYVGRLSHEKGILFLLNAFKRLIMHDNQRLKLWIVGDGELRNEVEDFIKTNNMESHVTLFGLISHNKMPKFYNQADIFILPSFTEGSPAALLEAMASGLIIIANKVGAVPEIIRDNIDGFIIDKIGDATLLKEKIKKVLELNFDEKKKIRKNARERAEQLSKDYLKRHLTVYTWLCKRGEK